MNSSLEELDSNPRGEHTEGFKASVEGVAAGVVGKARELESAILRICGWTAAKFTRTFDRGGAASYG